MKLDKENMRKMRELILFTIIILIALWNYKMIFDAIVFILGIVLPFLVGGAIAFVLNVPMSFFASEGQENCEQACAPGQPCADDCRPDRRGSTGHVRCDP